MDKSSPASRGGSAERGPLPLAGPYRARSLALLS